MDKTNHLTTNITPELSTILGPPCSCDEALQRIQLFIPNVWRVSSLNSWANPYILKRFFPVRAYAWLRKQALSLWTFLFS